MTYPLDKKIEEFKEMIKLIPKIQSTVKNAIGKHYNGLESEDGGEIKDVLHSLRKAIDILDSKYVLDIIFVLSRQDQLLYFNELKKMLPYVNVGTLSKRLKELEKQVVIERKVYPNERPIRVSYNLTKMGYGIFYLLLPLLVYVTYYDLS